MNKPSITGLDHQQSLSHLLLFVALGIAFWLDGVLFIRFLGENLFVKDNPWLVFLFMASIPIAWVLVKIAALVGHVEGEQLLSATALMAITGLVLDGIGLTWFQNWYDLDSTQLILAAAWLLWGVGVSLAIGYRASQA